MAGQEFPIGDENVAHLDSAHYQDRNIFEDLISDARSDMLKAEKADRNIAFLSLGMAASEYRKFCLAALGTTHAFHKTYTETPMGDAVERLVFAGSTVFPGYGELFRVILNDISTDPLDWQRKKVMTQDFVVSLTSKMITWQATTVKTGAGSIGPAKPDDGPILLALTDNFTISAGSGYSMTLPKVRGYPLTLSQCMEATEHAKTVSQVISNLGPDTYEPGVTNNLGIL